MGFEVAALLEITLSVPIVRREKTSDEELELEVPDAAAPGVDDAVVRLFKEVEALKAQASVARVDFVQSEFESGALGGPDSKMEPFMRDAERAKLLEVLRKATNYLEFGSGGSTVAAVAVPSIKRIHSVESAGDWINLLKKRSDVSTAIASGRLNIVDAGTGGGGLGYPTKERKFWPRYSGEAALEGEADDTFFDTVLVDGRFRVACLLRALQRVKVADVKRVTIMLHDYDRRDYHVVERFANVTERVDRLALFRKRSDIDDASLSKTIADYLYEQY
eukprot:TRINITY_DN19576_c0_g1_i2.p1 TRINITY_DN19576_c0_g1~~TRINITY_DN19576_c0_g1_i2.p1  ORF type:complete len:277 (-),score=37.56 TRINITY_DN19576_c0_g1_i2:294-1124(-)